MKTVLIVDEDAFTRNVFAQTLSSRGFEVRHADSGVEALRSLGREMVDLVVVDASLSDTDGTEFVRALRQLDGTCRVVVLWSVFRSASADYDALTKDLGVSLVLHKPISPVEFCAQVEHVFDLSVESRRWIPDADADGLGEVEENRLAYRATIEAKFVELESMIELVRRDATTFVEVERSAALLRDAASRYGFFGISRAAARVEAGLQSLQAGEIGDTLGWTEVQDALDDAFMLARAPHPLDAGGEPPRQDACVLVVDDDPEFLEQVRKYGREHFIRIVTAQHPDEVVDKIRDPAIDVMLVAVDLGEGVDTFALMRGIRERSAAQRMPLGFIAEHGRLPDRVMAAHLGASVFVEKPVDSAQFADIVQRLIATRQEGRRPTVVVVDRDEGFVSEVTEILSSAGMDAHHVDSTSEVIERIDDLAPDGMIVSVSMPGIGGFDLCRMVRAMPRWHDLPILLVGDQMDPQTRIAAFRSGADDYLLKPPVREELLARLQVRIERLRLLREQASLDMLTGLLSRRPFLQRVNARLSEARRGDRQLALTLLDLDGFKEVNDTYGHMTGDRVLAALGRLLTNRFRMEDLRGRWGGEEFVVALIGEEAETAELVMQRTLDEFRNLEFLGEHGERFSVTFSTGIAVFPRDGDNFRALLDVADRRLYQAKAQGKNCIVA